MTGAPVLSAVVVATPDADRMRCWYTEVLGLDAPGSAVLLFDERPDVRGRAAEPGRLTLTLVVPNLPEAKRRLCRAGTRWVDEMTAEDPDGNLLRLVARR